MRVAFITLGCRLNQFETESMRRRLRGLSEPVRIVSRDEEADVYVINSCSVTTRAEKKCRQIARSIRRRFPAAKIVVAGCIAQLHGEELPGEFPFDAILGNEEKRRLEEFLPALLDDDSKIMAVSPYPPRLPIAEEWVDGFSEHSRASLKVQEGCDLRCTFCSVWRSRGPSRSLNPGDVIRQARALEEAGYQEIVLTGIHLGHYGRDLPGGLDLEGLLTRLLKETGGQVHYRLSSLDPDELDEELLEKIFSERRICRYLHLALQSGSDRILRAMGRRHGTLSFARSVKTIHREDPLFGIGTDIITGFPGETEEDFHETFTFLRDLPVAYYHIFPYSDRPGTAACLLSEKVPGQRIVDRGRKLRELGEKRRLEFLHRNLGRRAQGIVEGSDEDGHEEAIPEASTGKADGIAESMAVRLGNYAMVWAPRQDGMNRKMVEVQIQSIDSANRLRGIIQEQG